MVERFSVLLCYTADGKPFATMSPWEDGRFVDTKDYDALAAQLEVAHAARLGAESQARWQAVTNRELNELSERVRALDEVAEREHGLRVAAEARLAEVEQTLDDALGAMLETACPHCNAAFVKARRKRSTDSASGEQA